MDVGGAIDHEIAFVADPGFEPGQRFGCWALDFFSVASKFAAVAGAGDDAEFLVPCGETAEVGADGVEGEEALGGAHEIDTGGGVEGDRVDGEVFWFADVDDGRRLVEDVGGQELVSEAGSTDGCDAEGAETYLGEEGAAVDLDRW